MGEPERGEALLFFSLLFAQVKNPRAREREIIIKGAHREGAKEQRREEKASPEKRRPEAQERRERRARGAEERAEASEREREASIKEEERAKGAAKGAASLAEEAKLIFLPRSETGKEAAMAKEKKKPGRSKERSMEKERRKEALAS